MPYMWALGNLETKEKGCKMTTLLPEGTYMAVCLYLRENDWFQDGDDHGIWRNREGNHNVTIGEAFDLQLIKDEVDQT